MASTKTIAEHYGHADLGMVILAALNAAGILIVSSLMISHR
jgi:hypothetical protein